MDQDFLDCQVECQLWMEAATGLMFPYPNDFRESLDDGVLLCELMRKISPDSMGKPKRNRRSSAFSTKNNIRDFLKGCQKFGLDNTFLFHTSDLDEVDDPSLSLQEKQEEEERRLRRVCFTLYQLGKKNNQDSSYCGPRLNCRSLSGFANSVDLSSDLFCNHYVTNIEDEVFLNNQRNKSSFKQKFEYNLTLTNNTTSSVFHHSQQPLTKMERRLRSKGQGMHVRSHSLPESPVNPMHDMSKSAQSATFEDFEKKQEEIDAEQDKWMSSFSSWKMKRKSVTSTERERKAERDEVEEVEVQKNKRKGKTFREIVEEKQRREKYIQKTYGANATIDTAELQNILADLPSTNLDSEDEDEVRREKERSSSVLSSDMIDIQSEIRPRPRTLSSDTAYPTKQMAPPPVKPKPIFQPRSGHYRPMRRSHSVEEKIEINTSNSTDTFSAPPPSGEPASSRREPASSHREPSSSHRAPSPPHRAPSPPHREPERVPSWKSDKEPQNRISSWEPHNQKPDWEPQNQRPIHNSEPETKTANNRKSFYETLMEAKRREHDRTNEVESAREEAQKPWRTSRKSGIFDKIKAFNRGEAFVKPDAEDVAKKPQRQNAIQEEDYTDVVINMSQQPRSQRGFGFELAGGSDVGKPLYVSKISKGSVAFLSELKEKDEIILIDNEKAKLFAVDDIAHSMSRAILSGKLSFKIRRYPAESKRHDIEAPTVYPPPPKSQSQKSRPPPTVKPKPSYQPPSHSRPESVNSYWNNEKPIDGFRPDPTRNALARAKRMLDDLEDETSSSSDFVTEDSLRRKQEEGVSNYSPELSSPEGSTRDKPLNEVDTHSIGSTEEEQLEARIMERLQDEEKEHQEHEKMHQQITEHEHNQTPVREPTLRPNTLELEESAAPVSTAVEHPYRLKTYSTPKPFGSQPPEAYRPVSTQYSAMRETEASETVRNDMQRRRTDFFSDDEDDVSEDQFSSKGYPISASVETKVESVPVYRPMHSRLVPSNKKFNRDEERKRLERWNEEQEKRRQLQYAQEQQRLQEEQERALEQAMEDVKKKRDEEQKALEEKQEAMKKQMEELREKRKKQLEEEERRRKEKLDQQRIAWEEEEKQRQEEEERLAKIRAEEERLHREQMERERIHREKEEKERLARQKEEDERRQKEKERKERERLAKERVQREQEEYARQLHERQLEKERLARQKEQEEEMARQEEEAQRERQEMERWKKEREERDRLTKLKAEQEQAKKEEMHARIREQEIERIRQEERERMRQEWEKQRAGELEQLRAEQDKLKREKEELQRRQEEEKQRLRKEKDKLNVENTRNKVEEPELMKITNGSSVMSEPPPRGEKTGDNYIIKRTPLFPVDGDKAPSKGYKKVSPPIPRVRGYDDRKMVPERDIQPSYMSKYKENNPSQKHWLLDEAERRLNADRKGIDRSAPPDVVIPPKKNIYAEEPVLERKQSSHLESAPPSNYSRPTGPRTDQQNNPRNYSSSPRSYDAHKPIGGPLYRDYGGSGDIVAHSPRGEHQHQPVRRRPRGTGENELDRQRKLHNRRSLPEIGADRDHAVPGYVQENRSTPPRGISPSQQRLSLQPHGSPSQHRRVPQADPRGPSHSIPGQGSAFQQPNKSNPPSQSISGKLQCCNCGKLLGRGAAMIIESLGLHYHLECFRCCVCSIQLGNGTKGADVRIRSSQLHCQNCYSNEAGFQFTEV